MKGIQIHQTGAPDVLLYEDLAETCGTFARPKTAAVSLNTSHLDEESAKREVNELEQKLGIPVCDPIRDGANKILTALGF